MRTILTLVLVVFLPTKVFAQVLSERMIEDPQERCLRIYDEALQNRVASEGYSKVLEDLAYALEESRVDDVRRHLSQLKDMTTNTRRQRTDLQECVSRTDRYLRQIVQMNPENIDKVFLVLNEQVRVYRLLSTRLIELPEAKAKVVKALEKKYKPK